MLRKLLSLLSLVLLLTLPLSLLWSSASVAQSLRCPFYPDFGRVCPEEPPGVDCYDEEVHCAWHPPLSTNCQECATYYINTCDGTSFYGTARIVCHL